MKTKFHWALVAALLLLGPASMTPSLAQEGDPLGDENSFIVTGYGTTTYASAGKEAVEIERGILGVF